MPSIKPRNETTESLAVSKADVGKRIGANLSVMGNSGTKEYAGYFMEEYNTAWRDDQRITNVEEMRRGDGAVRAGLRAIKSPLLATKWTINTKDDTPRGEEIRAFVDKNLLLGMDRSWKKFLREALAYLDFGFYCFELIWEKRDGKVWLKDLAPRIPSSIEKWTIGNGERGITQLILNDKAKQTSAEIPMWKLLVLTNDMEGDDITGQSILRAPFKHWNMKQTLYKIQGIAAERYGVGVPVITLGEGAGEDEKAAAEDWGSSLRSNEKGYVVLFNDTWKVEILTPTGNPQGEAIISAIDHHDHAILHALLVSFLMLGSGSGGGSYALSTNLITFFFKCVEDMGNYFTEEMNKQVIKQMVDLNFGKQEIYPELKFTPLGDMDTVEMSNTLKTLADAGLIHVDADLIKYVHDTFKLPEIPQETLDQMKEDELTREADLLDPESDQQQDPNADPNKPTQQEAKPTQEEPVPQE